MPWQPEFSVEFKSLKYSKSAPPKDHFCVVSLKSDRRFQSRLFYGNCLRTDRQTDINRSQ